MRSESEMFRLIVDTAESDDRIRAAYLEGSRANPNIPRDIFQDYDVEFIVTDTTPFRKERHWIDRFGKRLFMQYPDESAYYPGDTDNCYGWLMQFADGNRLDLHVCTKAYALSHLELYRVLIDKDAVFSKPQNTSDEIYWVKKPTQEQFSCTCNEFWWCLDNIAKGLWRGELTYGMDMLNFNVRPMLRRLLDWKAGMENNFSISTGKSSKYMGNYLSKAICEKYLLTYPPARTDAVWDAVFVACELFQSTALEISKGLGLSYDLAEGGNCLKYLKHVRRLPSDAKEIY